jgi:diacylglycerol kinase family enzyme
VNVYASTCRLCFNAPVARRCNPGAGGSVAKSLATFQRLTGAEWTSLIEQADVAVIFGGDGTVYRHLAELVELEIPVLIVPCGSGNDFARALNIRNVRDASRAWNSFAASG